MEKIFNDAQKMKNFIDKVYKEFDLFQFEQFKLTKSEYNLLHIVIESYKASLPINMSKTSKLLCISKPALTQLLHRSGFKGYIRKYTMKDDKKSVYLKPTKKGQTLHDQVQNTLLQEAMEFINIVGTEDFESLINILEKYLIAKEKKGEEKNA